MPFKPLDIKPGGLRQDFGSITEEPGALDICENLLFDRQGVVRGRPAAISIDQTAVSQSLTGNSIEGNLPGDLYAISSHRGVPIVISPGNMWRRAEDTALWSQTGTLWSVTEERSAVLPYRYLNPSHFATTVPAVHVGAGLVAAPFTKANFLPLDKGEVLATPTNYTNVWNTTSGSQCMAGGVLFVNDAGNIRMLFGYPTVTTVTVATDGLVTGAQKQGLWAVTASVGGASYWVAYFTSALSLKILALNASGGIVNTLVYTGAVFDGTVGGASIGLASSATKGILAVSSGAGVATRIFNPTTLVDSALPFTITPSFVGSATGVAVGFGPLTTRAWVVFHGVSNPTMDVWLSRLDVAGASQMFSFKGFAAAPASAPDPGYGYKALFPPTLFQGRMLIGLQYSPKPWGGVTPDPELKATWMVLDMSEGQTSPALVAAGGEGESLPQAHPGSAYVDALTGSLSFACPQGVRFSSTGVSEAAPVVFTLTLAEPKTAEVGGSTYFSGQYPYVYDGIASYEAGFPVRPEAKASVITLSSGFAAGSYTLQAVWTFVDGKGGVTRSSPSDPVTVSVTGITQGIRYRVNTPVWTSKGRTSTGTFFVEVYVSQVNPTAGADLYLVDSIAVDLATGLSGSGAPSTVNFDLTQAGVVGSDVLYTGGNIVGNERAFASGGLSVCQNRLWAGQGNTLYASKFLRAAQSASWSQLDSFVVNVPSGYGEVRSLESYDDKLIVLCERGILVTAGPGPEDTGLNGGFALPELVYTAEGPTGPRYSCTTTRGVIWSTPNGNAHLLSRSLQGQQISDPVLSEPLGAAAFVDGIADNNPIVVFEVAAARMATLDLSTGVWGVWTLAGGENPLSITGIDGLLYMLSFGVSPLISKFGGQTLGTDENIGSYSGRLRTRPAPMSKWGRCRSVQLWASPPTTGSCSVRCQVYSDERRAVATTDKTLAYSSTLTANWPRSGSPEFRTTVQRARAVSVELTMTPPTIQLSQLTLWVSETEEEAPSRNRG